MQNWPLITQMTRREIFSRYRGTTFGWLWAILTPLAMLVVYTFVFGTVLKARWAELPQDSSTAEFAVILFGGLIVFQLLSEVVNLAPSLIISNTNYVKKVVFPLEVIVPVALGAAMFHAAVSVGILLIFAFVVFGAIPLTSLLIPLILAPFCLLLLGLGWFLASIGTYLRDIQQLLGPIVTALMFLAPLFYPITALPEWVRPWVFLNPITLPVEQLRDVVVFGRLPSFGALGLYAAISLIVAVLGYFWFPLIQ